MKKKLLCTALIASLILSAAGCGETENSIIADNAATTAAADNNTTADEDNAAKTTAATASETEPVIEESEDYSEAKEKIEVFLENVADYSFGVITDNRKDCWFYYDSYIDGENGGDYNSDYWSIYVTNEDTKEIISFNNLNPTSEASVKYDWHQRVGYGNFKIRAVYNNDELGVYFYAEDEVNLNESNVSQEGDFLVYHYNLTELIGEEITAKTYQLEK